MGTDDTEKYSICNMIYGMRLQKDNNRALEELKQAYKLTRDTEYEIKDETAYIIVEKIPYEVYLWENIIKSIVAAGITIVEFFKPELSVILFAAPIDLMLDREPAGPHLVYRITYIEPVTIKEMVFLENSSTYIYENETIYVVSYSEYVKIS